MSEATTKFIPHHIAIIPDGNRRWAKDHGLSSLEGHKAGMDVLEGVARAAFDRGVKCISAYAFSTENWKRTEEEVSYLMALYLRYAKGQLKKAMADNIRICVSGSRDQLNPKLQTTLTELEDKTKHNTDGIINICLNYGGQEEIVAAVRKIIAEGTAPEDVTEDLIKAHLYTADIPAPDLIIRTSGEQRLSNFLLWDSAYSELIFVDKNWPDFNEVELGRVLDEYAQRQRRFGA
jgi:undecaprenyl diphosphate synthase